jgi:hypothetical protein
VVALGVDKVQSGGPARVHADFVGPGSDRREVTGRVVRGGTRGRGRGRGIGIEDGADGGEDLGVEVGLGDGGDDFVACLREEKLELERDKIWEGRGGEGRRIKRTCCAPSYDAWEAAQAK